MDCRNQLNNINESQFLISMTPIDGDPWNRIVFRNEQFRCCAWFVLRIWRDAEDMVWSFWNPRSRCRYLRRVYPVRKKKACWAWTNRCNFDWRRAKKRKCFKAWGYPAIIGGEAKDKVPAGLTIETIPAADWAVFTITSSWSFSGRDADSPDYEWEIWIPVKNQ